MNLFNLMATMGLDTTEFERGLTEAQGKTQETANKLKTIATSNEKVNNGFKKIGNAAKVMGGMMVAGLGYGINAAADLDSTMKKLQAQTGLTDAEMQDIEKSLFSIKKMGTNKDIDEIAESFAYATQIMGGTTQEIEGITKNAISLSDAFGMDVNSSIETVNGMMKTFGISSDEAFNILAQGSQNGANAQGDLLETIREFSPAFNEMGFSASDMVNTLIDGGQEGAFQVNKIADAMNEFTTKATDGNKATQEAFKTLGFEANQVEGAIAQGGETAKSTFLTMVERLANVGDAVEQERLGVALFGTMWEDSGAKAILSLGNTKGVIDENKNAMEGLNTQYNTLDGFLIAVKTSFDEWAIGVVNNLLPPLRELHTWITENQGTVNLLAGAIMGVVTAILIYKAVNFAMLLGGMVKAMYTAITTTGLLTTAQTALNGAMMLNPIGLIIGLIGGLIAIIIYLWNTNEGFRAFWVGAWEGIKSAFSTAWESIKAGWTSMIEWFGNLGNKIVELKNNWVNRWNEMKNNVMTAIQGMIQWFIQLPQRLGENLRACITRLIQWVTDMKNKGKEAAQGLVNNVVNTLKTLPSKAFEIAKRIPSMIWNGIQSMSGWLFDRVSGFFSNIFSNFSASSITPMANIQNTMNFGGANGFNSMSAMNARARGSMFDGAFRPQQTNVSLSIGGREFDKLIIKTVANNFGAIETRVQSKERGKR